MSVGPAYGSRDDASYSASIPTDASRGPIMGAGTAQISGVKWNDLNGNGVQDGGELGLLNWPIYLDLNHNGRWDENEGEPLQQTDADGGYTFTGLDPGTYVVAEVLQTGWDQTFPAVGEGLGSAGEGSSSNSTLNAAAGQQDLLGSSELAADPASDAPGSPQPQTYTWDEPRPVSRDAFSATRPPLGTSGAAVDYVTVNADPEGDMPIAVAFTPDGQSVLVVNRDTNNLQIFDAATRTSTAIIPVGDCPVDVAVSPDGHYAVVSNLFGDSVSIVDLSTRTVAATVPITGSQPYRAAITADGAYAVVGVINDAVNSSFSVISLSTLSEVRSFPSAPQGETGFTWTSGYRYKSAFTQFKVSPDNATIVLPVEWQSRVVLYDLNTGSAVADLSTAARPMATDISSDGTTAVVSHEVGTNKISVIDLVSRSVTSTFSKSEYLDGMAIRITPDKRFAIVGVMNNVIFVDLGTGATTATLFTGAVYDLEISSDGKYVFVSNSLAAVIDIASQTIVKTLSLGFCYEAAVSPKDGRAAALNNLWGDDVRFCHVAGAASTVEGSVQSGAPPDGDDPVAVAFASDGPTLVVGNQISNNVSIINADTGTVRAYVDVGSAVYGLATTPDGAYAVVALAKSDTVSIISLATDSVVATLTAASAPWRVLNSPDGQTAYVASGSGTDRVHFIHLAGAASSVVGTVAPGNIGQMALTPDGTRLGIYNYYDGQFVLVDTATRTVIAQAVVPTGGGDDKVAFSPDGSRAYVANFSAGRVLVIAIDGATCQLAAIIGGIDYANSVNVDATGQFVYVGGNYGSGDMPALYVIHAPTNSVIRTVLLGSTQYMHPQAAYLSPADSVLYVVTDKQLLTSDGWIRDQALYRVAAAGASSALVDATPLTSTASGLAFSEALKTAAVAQPYPDGVELVDYSGSRTDGTHVVELGAGQEVPGINFGNRALGGLIHGIAWNDLDGDRAWDQSTEPALKGCTFYLDLDGDGSFDQSTEPHAVSDAQGNYWFRDLEGKTYTVAQVLDAGWEQTYPAAADGGVHQVTLGPGELADGNIDTSFVSGGTGLVGIPFRWLVRGTERARSGAGRQDHCGRDGVFARCRRCQGFGGRGSGHVLRHVRDMDRQALERLEGRNCAGRRQYSRRPL